MSSLHAALAATLALAFGAAATTAVQAAEPTAAATPAFASDRISVRVVGQGPDVILIPGLACAPEVWDQLVAKLAATHRLHLVQLKGFAGLKAEVGEGPVFEPAAQALARYIREARLDHPAVIGHSLGGEMGLWLAEHEPAVGRVLVIDALPFFSLVYGPTATVESAKPYAAMMVNQLMSAQPEAFAANQKALAEALVRDPSGREAVLRWSLASDRRTMAQAAADLMVTDLRPGLASISTPVTVLYAADDDGAPAARADALYAGAYAGLKGVKLIRVDASRHFIMLDQPARFGEAVEAFLAGR